MELLDAASRGDSTAVRRLLAAGADPSARGLLGETALHLAAVAGNTAVLQQLLDAGAVGDARAPDGSTALMKAEIGRAHV